MSDIKHFQEGDKCAECEGTMVLPLVQGCSCHINPPCSACVDNKLTCDKCGWEYEPIREDTYRSLGPISERLQTHPSHDFGNGKRIYDFGYNSNSGSTMVWQGRFAGDVTAEDIKGFFGSGTFGHRGPVLGSGTFTYTLITD